MFWIVPLCSGAVVLLTYALGLRVTSPLAALGGTLLIAASPTTLFMTLWPMSDVPVTAFWLAALVLALRTPARPLAVGVLTGIAILIRPNLAPLALVPVALLAVNAWPQPRPRLVNILAVSSAAIAACALIVAAIHTYLYGGPLRSGYGAGDASKLYAVANIVPNIKQYGGWLFQSQGVLAAVAVLAWLLQLLWRTSLTNRLLAVFVAIVAASYLPYIVFDDWWYLRFFLPALPILYLFAASLIERAIGRLGASVQATVTTAVVLAMCGHALAFAFQKEIFGIGEGEQRYVDVGRFVRDELPRNAVVLAMQHGGSIRYYAGNTTIRYDLLTTARLDQAVDLLRGWQYGPYLVLEDWEEPLFRDRFKEQQTLRTLDQRLLAVLDSNTSVRIYDLSEQAVPGSPRTIKHIPRTRCCGRFDEE